MESIRQKLDYKLRLLVVRFVLLLGQNINKYFGFLFYPKFLATHGEHSQFSLHKTPQFPSMRLSFLLFILQHIKSELTCQLDARIFKLWRRNIPQVEQDTHSISVFFGISIFASNSTNIHILFSFFFFLRANNPPPKILIPLSTRTCILAESSTNG